MRNPILSSKADDPQLQGEIEKFIVQLAERVDSLQDAEWKGDRDELCGLARSLGERATALGFETLSATALAIERCCEGGDAEVIRETLLDLTEIAKRIRLGHRGAV